MTPDRTHITPQIRDVVGLELRRGTSFPITDSDIRRSAIVVYYPEPAPRLFWDAGYAAGTAHGGIVAPEEFNPFAWMTQPETDQPETPRVPAGFVSPEETLGIEPPAAPSLINGGTEVDYGVRMRPGDVITSVDPPRRLRRTRRPARFDAVHDLRGRLDQPAGRDGQDLAQHVDPVLTWPSTAVPSPSGPSSRRSSARPASTTGTGTPP